MTRADVTRILGTPLRERSGDANGGVLLDYAIPGIALKSFSFWIDLDEHGTVRTAHVEAEPLVADNYALYEARVGRPVYEHPSFVEFIERAR